MSTSQVTERMLESSHRAGEFVLRRPECVPIGVMMAPQIFLMIYFLLGWLFQRPPATIGLGPVLDAVAGVTFIFGGGLTVWTAREVYFGRTKPFPMGWVYFTVLTLLFGGTYVIQYGSRTAWLITYLLCAPFAACMGALIYWSRKKVMSGL